MTAEKTAEHLQFFHPQSICVYDCLPASGQFVGTCVGILAAQCWYRSLNTVPHMALTDAKCRSAKPKATMNKLSDGGGLQLWVQPTGAKLWRLAYRFSRRQKLLTLGVYPAVSLEDARTARHEAKQLLGKGQDPSEARKASKAAAVQSGTTFRAIAEEYLAHQRQNSRADSTMAKLEWLLGLAYPQLGEKEIAAIRPPEVLQVLRKIEARGRYETARRLRSTMGVVFRSAIASGRAETDPTTSLQGLLATPPRK